MRINHPVWIVLPSMLMLTLPAAASGGYYEVIHSPSEQTGELKLGVPLPTRPAQATAPSPGCRSD
ncbi:MAG: hypothetical protein KA354_21595 [Phycisphaerae bacterium]|nr:hypothetical protein [Phycisphaerae bacterium]